MEKFYRVILVQSKVEFHNLGMDEIYMKIFSWKFFRSYLNELKNFSKKCTWKKFTQGFADNFYSAQKFE